MYWSIFCGIAFLAFGIFIYLKPNLIWEITEQWKSYSADEPSELYIKSTKVGGILFALLGLAMTILPVIVK